MRVLKFGGTSLQDASAFERVAEIIASQVTGESRVALACVTSAMAGITNRLVDTVKAAAAQSESVWLEACEEFRTRHMQIARQFQVNPEQLSEFEQLLETRLSEYSSLCRGIGMVGEVTPKSLDVASGLGEYCSTPLLVAVLRSSGVPSDWVDGRQLIVTDSVHGQATPDLQSTRQRCRELLMPLLDSGTVPVITGFVSASHTGLPTTLGRGGSDYSAAIIGACLEASEVQIWTDVDGVLTADPNVVPEARTLRELTYDEVAELAYFGAKVLHPKTTMPCLNEGIPIRVLNTFNPTHPGTRISSEPGASNVRGVRALAAIRDIALITLTGRGMIGIPGIAARVFACVARLGANVMLISQSSSEESICFVVPESDRKGIVKELKRDFQEELEGDLVHEINSISDIVILAAVGQGMQGTPGISGRLFSALGDAQINIVAIAQGATQTNISLVVADADADKAMQAIHTQFDLGGGASEVPP